MRKWTSKSCCLLISVLVLCAVSLSAFTICGSASNVTGLNFVPMRGNVQPYIVQVDTDLGTYSYYFYDTVYGYEHFVIDTQELTYTANDNIAYYYTLASEEVVRDDANIYLRFDREYDVTGFIYNVDTTEFIKYVERISTSEDENGDLLVEYRTSASPSWFTTDISSEYIIGTMNFDYLYELEEWQGVNIVDELRNEIKVKRDINSSLGTCTFSFHGLGLYDDDLNPYDITITDDNAYYNTATDRGYMSIYGNGVPVNKVSNVRAVGYKIESIDDRDSDYYQTHENTQTIWIFDDEHALPSLMGNKISNMSLPEYTHTLASNEYIKLTSSYEYTAQGFTSYISNTGGYNSVMELSELTFGAPVDESAPYTSILPWGWLDLELEGFNLVTFLDKTTQFLFVDIIGVFSIADIVGIVIGISLLFAFLKLYLGG